jgi:hypothetical protein
MVQLMVVSCEHVRCRLTMLAVWRNEANKKKRQKKLFTI